MIWPVFENYCVFCIYVIVHIFLPYILGYQSRLVFCTFDNEAYSDYLCASIPRPLSNRTCNEQQCPQTRRYSTFTLAYCSVFGALITGVSLYSVYLIRNWFLPTNVLKCCGCCLTCGESLGLTALAVLFLFCKVGVCVRAAFVEAHGSTTSQCTSVQVTAFSGWYTAAHDLKHTFVSSLCNLSGISHVQVPLEYIMRFPKES